MSSQQSKNSLKRKKKISLVEKAAAATSPLKLLKLLEEHRLTLQKDKRFAITSATCFGNAFDKTKKFLGNPKHGVSIQGRNNKPITIRNLRKVKLVITFKDHENCFHDSFSSDKGRIQILPLPQ